MEVYRQKELYRTELLKQIFNLDIMGVTNVLQLTNPYGNFNFTYGLRMVHDLFGAESRVKQCDNPKFTIEDIILDMASQSSIWCESVSKSDALGEIAILLWNAGVEFQNASTVGLMAASNIPLAGIQRLDTLMSIRDALKSWAFNWFPNENDLETIMSLTCVTSDLVAFLELLVRGRFERDYDNSYRDGLMSWSDLFQTVVAQGIDGGDAFDVYTELKRSRGISDTVTRDDFTYERRNKRRRNI